MSADPTRTLSDADARAIAEAFFETGKEEFFREVGKAFWKFVWKAIVTALFGIAIFKGATELK